MPRLLHRSLRFLPAALLAAQASAQNLVFTPVADAVVRDDQRGKNFATTDLGVQRDDFSAGSAWKRSFLEFDVSGLAGRPIESLALALTEGSDGPPGDAHFEVRAVGNGWSESTVTWTKAPTFGGRRIGAWTGPALRDGQTIHVTLDPTWLRQDGTVTLLLIEINTGGKSASWFQSREDASPPRLIVGSAGLPAMSGFICMDPEGPVPFTPDFVPCSPLTATSYLWEFGDGGTSTARKPNHTYLRPGRYTVRLTTFGPAGSAVCERQRVVQAYAADRNRGSVLGWRKLSESFGGNTPRLRPGDMFGRSAIGCGDVDGDGIGDLLVGAVGEDRAASSSGAVWLLFMNADGSVRTSRKITAGLSGFDAVLDSDDGFGRGTAAIGDWDLDGVPDVAVGANRDDDGGPNRGAVYLLFLNRDGSVKAWRKLSHGNLGFSLDNYDEFGRGIARIEDLDFDGVPELAVGAIGDDDGASDNGAVWILFMRRDGSLKGWSKLSSTSGGLTQPFVRGRSGTWFGMHVAALGDVDGDGVTDIAVGALRDDSQPHASGAVRVILLQRNGRAKADRQVNGASGGLDQGELEANDELGGAVAGPGDIDGDGIPDLVASAIRDDDNPVRDTDLFGDWGALYVFFLRADGSVREYQKISATRGRFGAKLNKYDRIGEGLGAVGDVNADGIPDIVIGARFDDDGGSNKGAVYVLTLNDGSITPPRADFDSDLRFGDAPLGVAFVDRSTGTFGEWLWEFGDGATSDAANPSHVYALPGTYAVTLTVSGHGGSATRVAQGYVTVTDGSAAANVTPLGCGVNPAGSFLILAGSPRLGSSMVIGLHNPLGTQNPGALSFVSFALAPPAGTPCGILRRGNGMQGPGAYGELLIDVTTLVETRAGAPWTGDGPAVVMLALPSDPALAGLSFYAQGRLVDRSPGAAVRIGLTDGARLLMGL